MSAAILDNTILVHDIYELFLCRSTCMEGVGKGWVSSVPEGVGVTMYYVLYGM